MKRVTKYQRMKAPVMQTLVCDDPIIDIERLKDEFDFKWRVSNTNKFSKKCSCVAYCDSRSVQDVLDNVCGPENWQDKYYNVDGVVYCSIGIKLGGEWVWKTDCGVESNIEKEKGEASDAFKRAGVKWGIGRFLYGMRNYQLPAIVVTRGGKEYWVPADKGGKELPPWAVTDYINGMRGTTKIVPAADPDAKGDEAAQELSKLEKWLEKYDDSRVITALGWMGVEKSNVQYKKEGVADIPRTNFGSLCILVKLTAFDTDLIDMCLEGFGYDDIASGGIDKMLKDGKADKILDECAKIHKQEVASA